MKMTDVLLKFTIASANWLPPVLVGLSCTILGSLKLYGLARGILGGHEKPLMIQLCGT
jgi:hypothetical protein